MLSAIDLCNNLPDARVKLDDPMPLGKWKGLLVRHVIDDEPMYMETLVEKGGILLNDEAYERLMRSVQLENTVKSLLFENYGGECFE